MDEILTVKDIMNHLHIGRNKAYLLINTKDFPKIQIGHRYYIPKKQYEEWIERYTRHKLIL